MNKLILNEIREQYFYLSYPGYQGMVSCPCTGLQSSFPRKIPKDYSFLIPKISLIFKISLIQLY